MTDPQPAVGLTVDDLARLLAAANALSGHAPTTPFDQLTPDQQDTYRDQARTLLDRATATD